MNARYGRLVLASIAAVAVSITVAACGSDSSSTSTSSSTPSGTVTTAGGATISVPAELKGKPVVVATDASYAPSEFFDKDGKTIIGFDADLAKAIGQKLGLDFKVQNAGFDGIIPGLAAGKYGVGMSSFTDNKTRQKTVDFVDYFTAGTSFYIKQGGTPVDSIEGLCGKSVGVEKGTTQQDDAEAQAKKCKVDVQVFPDQNGVNLALSSGRVDVAMADSPVAAYQVKQSNGKFVLSGKSYGDAPYGIAVPKNSPLLKPIQEAVAALIADGTYQKILTQWGVQDGAIKSATINAGTGE